MENRWTQATWKKKKRDTSNKTEYQPKASAPKKPKTLEKPSAAALKEILSKPMDTTSPRKANRQKNLIKDFSKETSMEIAHNLKRR